VTNVKLALNAVATGNIQDGSVTTAKLADGAVTNAKLALNAVATGNIQDGSITTAKLEPALQVLFDTLEASTGFFTFLDAPFIYHGYSVDVYENWAITIRAAYNLATGESRILSFPSSTLLANSVRFDKTTGRVYAVYNDSTSGNTFLIYSDNFGQTWSTPKQVATGSAGQNAGAIDVEGNRIVVAQSTGTTVYVSLDGGSTWTSWPTPVPQAALGWVNGRLVIGSPSGDIYSTENGSTWLFLGRISGATLDRKYAAYRRGNVLYLGGTLSYTDGLTLEVVPIPSWAVAYVDEDGNPWYYHTTKGLLLDRKLRVAANLVTAAGSYAQIPRAYIGTRLFFDYLTVVTTR